MPNYVITYKEHQLRLTADTKEHAAEIAKAIWKLVNTFGIDVYTAEEYPMNNPLG